MLSKSENDILNYRLTESLEKLTETLSEPDAGEAYFVATIRYAATALTHYQANNSDANRLPLDGMFTREMPWLDYARHKLHDYIQAEPLRRSGLFGNLLFTAEENLRAVNDEGLNSFVLASLHRYTTYEHLTSEVISGDLQLRLPSSATT